MGLVGKALRLVVAALVAVPLGPGGICCCVVGCDAPGEVPAVSTVASASDAHSCCSGPASAAEAPSSGPADGCDQRTDRNDGDCDCPSRDAAVESSPTVVAAPATAEALRIDRAIAPLLATVLEAPAATRRDAAKSEAPLGPPVRLLLSVFLC